MMRKLLCLLAVSGMMIFASSAAMAQNAVLDPGNSSLSLKIGALPAVVVPSALSYGGTSVTLTNSLGSHSVALNSDQVFATVGNAPGTSLFTGVPFITNLVGTVNNPVATFNPGFSAPNPVAGNLVGGAATSMSGTLCPGGCIGGVAGLTGQIAIKLLNGAIPDAVVDLGVIGGGGTATTTVLANAITVTGAPWITGKARITGVTTNMISLPAVGSGVTGNAFTLNPASTVQVKTFTVGGNFVTSFPSAQVMAATYVSVQGTNALISQASGGDVTLVSPVRVDVSQVTGQVIPAKATMTLSLIPAPEPGTLLLLVSGAAGLAVIGRKRMKR